MPPPNAVSTGYHIEISGWDQAEDFFVERTSLDWSEEHGKKVHLRRTLQKGAVVFVRLIAPMASGDTFPIAYQVESVSTPDAAGMCEIRLAQLRPRRDAHGTSEQSCPTAPEEKIRCKA